MYLRRNRHVFSPSYPNTLLSIFLRPILPRARLLRPSELSLNSGALSAGAAESGVRPRLPVHRPAGDYAGRVAVRAAPAGSGEGGATSGQLEELQFPTVRPCRLSKPARREAASSSRCHLQNGHDPVQWMTRSVGV